MRATTLIVEDDPGLRASLSQSLARRGHEVLAASGCKEALALLRERALDLVLADLRLPDGSGLDLVGAARELDDEIVVLLMTAYPDVHAAVGAMKRGAWDYLVKPFELEELHLSIERALESRDLRRDLVRMQRQLPQKGEEGELLGASAAIERVRELVRLVAPADTPVLVTGETGTGKELVATAIHRLSPRRERPLVTVNCSAFSPALLESELFGHEKGAFTDARAARAGLFEMADGGTLLLDEIGEMRPELQARLLRVVEGQPFHRVGGERAIRADVRVVAATHRDLGALVQSGAFRQDLYFRLNAFALPVPPLRARGADVPLLARAFLDRAAAALGKDRLGLAPDACELLAHHDWPGNVRELKNVMERAAILCTGGTVDRTHLPGEIQVAAFLAHELERVPGLLPPLEEIERRYVALVMERLGNNISAASRALGITRNTLKARLREGAPTA